MSTQNAPEIRLWLAVIAKAVADVLSHRLDATSIPQKDLDTARRFVQQYPKIARRLSRLKSPSEIKCWLDEVEARLKEV